MQAALFSREFVATLESGNVAEALHTPRPRQKTRVLRTKIGQAEAQCSGQQ